MLSLRKKSNEKKICFAILVHNKREIIRDLIDNIRYFCPNSDIVLYNGGSDPNLCKDLEYPVCPTSKKLSYGFLTSFMLDVMEWLEEINYDYDYLISLDSDVLFAREGFEDFIFHEMQNAEYMGVDMRIPKDSWYPGVLFRKERELWRSLFKEDPFLKAFNVGQVFGRRFIQALLGCEQIALLKKNLRKTKCFAIEEIVFVNMAKLLGFEPKSYPKETSLSNRYRPHYTFGNFVQCMNEYPRCFLFHPVNRRLKDEVRWTIRNLMNKKRASDRQNLEKYIDGLMLDTDKIRKPPYFNRRKIGNSEWFEFVAPLKDGGLGHWRQNNDERGLHWFDPKVFDREKFGSVAMIHSRFNVLELVARKGEQLVHYWRDEQFGSEEWVAQESFAKGTKGAVAFIESSHGNFEVVAPLYGGGLGHWWRNNDAPGHPWSGPVVFGKEQVDWVSLIQSKSGKLIAVTESNGRLNYYKRDDNNTWSWKGPYS